MHRLHAIQRHFPQSVSPNLSEILATDVSASKIAATPREIINRYHPYLVMSQEVETALRNGDPIIALESTIISHGMPYPQNLETAIKVEQVARANGATPATIAILEGKIHIGLEREALETLAKMGHKCRKTSRRDLASVLAQKAYGATTVAATMYCASLAGISIFVTGGIGGVHRGVEETMDISADLTELGRTPVAVVCAGVKSILDIPRTLEYLETQGVTVASVGAKEFPAFFTRHSGVDAPMTVADAKEAAGIIAANRALDLRSGMVFAVPIPENKEAESKIITAATDQALAEVKAKNIQGRDITPFLLERIAQITNNHSLTSNIALVMNNCRFGASMAVALANHRRL